jgi:endonuclease YncB( thermonuclease family)
MLRCLMLFAISLLLAAQPVQAVAAGSPPEIRFAACNASPRITCVVDGDTLWYRGTKIRIADINTPEVSRPACEDEAHLADRATLRLIALLNEGPFELERAGSRDEDRYGRKLRIVSRSGVSLGETLVAEGLAERWTGRRRNWCPVPPEG